MSSLVQFKSGNLSGLFDEVRGKFEEDERKNFRILSVSTDLEKEDFLELCKQRFSVSRQGDLITLHTTTTKYGEAVEVYLYGYYKSEAVIFCTLNSSAVLKKTYRKLVENNDGIYYYWIPPNILEFLKEKILEEEAATLSGFEYYTESIKEYRDNLGIMESEGEHNGKDSYEKLEQWKEEYNIVPTYFRFRVPTKADFDLNNNGEFIIKRGDPDYVYDKFTNLMLAKGRELNKQTKQSEFKVVQEDDFERISQKPVQISISGQLEYDDKEFFKEKLQENDFGRHTLRIEEGSILISGKIVDEQNGGMLSIASDGQEFSVLPEYRSKYDTIMRFYRFITEELDSTATITLSESSR